MMSYLPIVVIVVLVLAFTALESYWRAASFKKRFPPIDDDEFIRRCRPGVNRDVALRVRRIISEQLGVEYERIYPESSFVNDLGCD